MISTVKGALDWFVNHSRVSWEKFADHITNVNLSAVEDQATNAAQLYAEIAVYIGMRGAWGRGDSGHEAALTEVQKRRKSIRKALGYSYP